MVLRRIANASPWPAPVATPPVPASPPVPQLLGFAEPVENVPPVETFVAAPGEVTAPVPETPAEILFQAAAPPKPVPPPEPVPEPEPPRLPVRDVPPAPAGSVPPAANRQRNLVGRLGRGLDEAPSVAPRMAEPHSVPTSPSEAAWPSASPGPTDRAGHPPHQRNRRLHRRASLPAEIEISGVPCTLIDVSIGGFAATGVPQIVPNAVVPVMIRLTIDGIEVGTELTARIVYVTQGRSAGRFIDLSPSQMAFLRYIVTWRGESVGAVGTTTLLDAIAGGPDRGFARGRDNRSDVSRKARWWEGLISRKNDPSPW
jgi:hypothetical protein